MGKKKTWRPAPQDEPPKPEPEQLPPPRPVAPTPMAPYTPDEADRLTRPEPRRPRQYTQKVTVG